MKNFENEKMNHLTVLKNSLKRQNEQGSQMMELVNHLMGVEERVGKAEERIDYKVAGLEETVESALEQITIDYEQQQEIKSIVNSKANAFTKEYYSNGMPESVPSKFHDDLFKKKKGRYIRRFYARLKSNFNVVRYTALRRVDYPLAKRYLEDIKFEHISTKEVEDLKSWNIPGLFIDEVS